MKKKSKVFKLRKMLVVVDLQRSFINENTEFIIDKIKKLVNSNEFDKVIFTKFVNNEDSIYVSKLNYKGCLTNEEQEIMIDTKDNIVLNKNVYTVYSDRFKEIVRDFKINEIYLCGIDTECCVLKSAFDLFEMGYDVKVFKDYCACTNGIKRHMNALEILRRNIGYNSIV